MVLQRFPTGPTGRTSNAEQAFADFEASIKSHKKRRRSDFDDDDSDSDEHHKDKHKKDKHRKEKARHDKHKDKLKDKHKEMAKRSKESEDFDDHAVHNTAALPADSKSPDTSSVKQEPKRVIPHDPALDLVNMDWMTSAPPPSSWRTRTEPSEAEMQAKVSAFAQKKPSLELNPQLNPESALLRSSSPTGATPSSHPVSRIPSASPDSFRTTSTSSRPLGLVGDGGASWSRSTGFDPAYRPSSSSSRPDSSIAPTSSSTSYSSTTAARWKKDDVRHKEEADLRQRLLEAEENRKQMHEEDELRRSYTSESQHTSSTGSTSSGSSRSDDSPPVDLNVLKSQIMKAKLQKNMDLAAKLELKLEEARKAQPALPSASAVVPGASVPSHVRVIDDLDEYGRSRSATTGALTSKLATQTEGQRANPRTAGLHSATGERLKYFADDEDVDLDTMVARERLEKRAHVAGGIGSMDSHYAENVMRKRGYREQDMFERNFDGDGDVDYGQWESREKAMSAEKLSAREKQRALSSTQRLDKATANCYYCLRTKKIPAHLIIAMGYHTSVILPERGHLIPGHVMIVPHDHIASCTLMEDSIFDEVTKFMRAINNYYESKGHQAVFLETVSDFSPWRHTFIDCIPLPKRDADIAPQYFQKAIKESGGEWATHQKIHEFKLPQRDIRNTIPQHFAYFMAQFGMNAGIAHHIEQKGEFEPNFGRQVVGGILELDEELYIGHPRRQSYDTERKLVADFKEGWTKYDWTREIN